jgi:hypothetical protein
MLISGVDRCELMADKRARISGDACRYFPHPCPILYTRVGWSGARSQQKKATGNESNPVSAGNTGGLKILNSDSGILNT